MNPSVLSKGTVQFNATKGEQIPYVEVEHASIAAMVEGIDKGSKTKHCKELNGYWHGVYEESSWFLCNTLAESKAEILAGWPDGVAQMQTGMVALRRLMPEGFAPVTERMQTQWDVAGDEVDIGRFLEGEPECMGTSETVVVPAQGRIVSIVIRSGVSGSVAASSIAKASVGALAIIDAIESTGLRCEVKVVTAALRADGAYKPLSAQVLWIPAKRAQDPLDMGQLAAAIHPDTFRRYGLYWRRMIDDVVGKESDVEIHWADWIPPHGCVLIDLSMICSREPADWVPAKMAEIMRQLGIESAA